MPKRNADGSWRGNNAPRKVSDRVIIARWVEAEAIRRKQRLAYSFETIAEQITQIGRGQAQPMMPLPEGVVFPKDYKISDVAVGRAFKKGMNRQVTLAAADMRQLDTERYEDLYRALQQGIVEGSPRHVDSAARVLENKAKLNGYFASRDQGPAVETHQNNYGPASQAVMTAVGERGTFESKVNLLRDSMMVLKELGVAVDIDLPDSEFKALPAPKTDPNDPA